MIESILRKYPNHLGTCSLDSPKSWCFTFVKNEKYLDLARKIDKNVVFIAPKQFDGMGLDENFELVENVGYVFTLIHNLLNKHISHSEDQISPDCILYPGSVMGCDGLHMAKAPDGSRVQMKHLGNIVIESGVVVMSMVTIARGVFKSTTLKRGSVVGHHCNIGHNSYVGENSVLAPGVILGGSSRVGDNCMIGMGAIVRNGVTICNDVIVGMGSMVVSDIVESGIYLGNPAKFYKPYDREWNFQ